MESTSRRAFLMGRRSAPTPWESFCKRVRRVVSGNLYDFGLREEVGSARLTPKVAEDVHHARALCAEYGVVLALDGIPHAADLYHQPVLWVDPGRDIAVCQPLTEGSTQWFVQPGCLLGELEAAGLRQFADLPCHITVAAWLADRSLCDWPPGETYRSGLIQISVLLADGSRASLGEFGPENKKPLDNPRLQRMVPALFDLAADPTATACRQAARWPARYRLDALSPANGHTVNLAHLLLGHGGDLGWVEWMVIDELAPIEPRPASMPDFSARLRPGGDAWLAEANSDQDARLKSLFDPSGIFPHPGQDL